MLQKLYKIKKPYRNGKALRVKDGARTHDPQNHNLVL